MSVKCSVLWVTAMAPNDEVCLSFQFSYGMEYLKIEYFCFAVSVIIILISLFGKIKESYKWFILNQAIFDLLIEYDYVCARPFMADMIFNPPRVKPAPTCIYYVDRFASDYKIGISKCVTELVQWLPLSMLFLLSFSRFLAIFKHNFYEKHDKWYRIFILLVVSNLVNAFFICFYNLRMYFSIGICRERLCTGSIRTGFKCNESEYLKCTDLSIYTYEIEILVRYAGVIFTTIWLLLSIIFSLSIFIKVLSHQISQSQINASRFLGSLKVSSVLFFQCFTATVFLLLSSYPEILYEAIPRTIEHYTKVYQYDFGHLSQPYWLSTLTKNYKCFNMLRIFLDSVMTLSVLTGYRHGLQKFFMFLLKFFPKIKKRFLNRNSAAPNSLFVRRSTS